MAEYVILIEKADRNYAAYVPDLPGCVATGVTREEVEASMREAVRFHLEGIKAEGLPIPGPSTFASVVSL